MAPSRAASQLGAYIDVPFNASLAAILVLVYFSILNNRAFFLLTVAATSVLIIGFDKTSSRGEMIKIMAELPLGLGSVLAFLVASRSFQVSYLPMFTTYVNFAVYGNINMMVGTPAGGTIRGLCSKITCVALSVWILQQGREVEWQTIMLHDQLFVFTAVSKSWIFAHAVYRFVLLTLPTFGAGRRHRLLEVYSLSMTFALSRASGLPLEFCFGMADTLVVPTAAAWSSIATTFDLIKRDAKDAPSLFGQRADMTLSALSLAVAVFSVSQVAHSPR